MPVAAAAFLEGGQVCVVGCCAVCLPRLAVAADAFAFDVAQVRDGRTRAGLLEIHQPHLDGGAACVRGERLAGEARGDVAAPQPRAGRFAALAAGRIGRLAGLAQHLGDEGIAAILRRAGTQAEAVGGVIAVPVHAAAPAQSSEPEGAMHAVSSMAMRHWHCSRHGAVIRRVPRQPHVQTGFVGTVVPHPSILPCIFPRPDGTGVRCPGGAAQGAARPPASATHACGMARSGQAVCTGECRAKRGANVRAPHRHEREGCLSDDRRLCKVMGVSPDRSVAPRRSRRMR